MATAECKGNCIIDDSDKCDCCGEDSVVCINSSEGNVCQRQLKRGGKWRWQLLW
jgi:hypothetical protein